MPRAFIAVKVDPTGELRAIHEALVQMAPVVKPVALEQLHVTLRFLGNASDEAMPLFARAVTEAALPQAPLRCELFGLGAFPSRSRPTVVWCGARHDEPLVALADRLSGLLEVLDVPPEARPWRTHVTLARVKGRPPRQLLELLEAKQDAALGPLHVAAVELLTSELTRAGARHASYARVTLTG